MNTALQLQFSIGKDFEAFGDRFALCFSRCPGWYNGYIKALDGKLMITKMSLCYAEGQDETSCIPPGWYWFLSGEIEFAGTSQ